MSHHAIVRVVNNVILSAFDTAILNEDKFYATFHAATFEDMASVQYLTCEKLKSEPLD